MKSSEILHFDGFRTVELFVSSDSCVTTTNDGTLNNSLVLDISFSFKIIKVIQKNFEFLLYKRMSENVLVIAYLLSLTF